MKDAAVAAQRQAVSRLDGEKSIGVLPGILLAAITFAPPYIQPATAETDARQFAAHALTLRAAGVAGDDAAIDVLAALPGAGAVSPDSLPVLWVPFFENAMVKLGRLQSAGPVALYYNPLLDIAVFTLWERHGKAYRVRLARAVPGERLNDAGAVMPLRPQWMASENNPIEVLAVTTAALDLLNEGLSPGTDSRAFQEGAGEFLDRTKRKLGEAADKAVRDELKAVANMIGFRKAKGFASRFQEKVVGRVTGFVRYSACYYASGVSGPSCEIMSWACAE